MIGIDHQQTPRLWSEHRKSPPMWRFRRSDHAVCQSVCQHGDGWPSSCLLPSFSGVRGRMRCNARSRTWVTLSSGCSRFTADRGSSNSLKCRKTSFKSRGNNRSVFDAYRVLLFLLTRVPFYNYVKKRASSMPPIATASLSFGRLEHVASCQGGSQLATIWRQLLKKAKWPTKNSTTICMSSRQAPRHGVGGPRPLPSVPFLVASTAQQWDRP